MPAARADEQRRRLLGELVVPAVGAVVGDRPLDRVAQVDAGRRSCCARSAQLASSKSAMNPSAPEFSALITSLRSVGPVISIQRCCRSARRRGDLPVALADRRPSPPGSRAAPRRRPAARADAPVPRAARRAAARTRRRSAAEELERVGGQDLGEPRVERPRAVDLQAAAPCGADPVSVRTPAPPRAPRASPAARAARRPARPQAAEPRAGDPGARHQPPASARTARAARHEPALPRSALAEQPGPERRQRRTGTAPTPPQQRQPRGPAARAWPDRVHRRAGTDREHDDPGHHRQVRGSCRHRRRRSPDPGARAGCASASPASAVEVRPPHPDRHQQAERSTAATEVGVSGCRRDPTPTATIDSPRQMITNRL